LSIAVVTQNASASEAQAENASKSDAVIRAIKAAAGAGAEVKTGGYSLQPQYIYKEGQAPVITSYIARNAVNVTTGALDRVGAILDAASRAGANSVDGLSFTLRRDEGARAQALANATREAMSKARVIAETLGGRVVRIVEVQEAGTAVRPFPISYAGGGTVERVSTTVQTPIEPGSLEVRAEVQLVAEIGAKE
ncbi:MAG: SIMPL domain-containing protein, partial [Rubrivivax sp.]|nr:SIMPL domain-containing protein [Pyrinomonadaceae bacterium]